MVLNYGVDTGVEEADHFIVSFILFIYIMLLGMLIFLSLTYDPEKCKNYKGVIIYSIYYFFSIFSQNFMESVLF